MKYVKLYEDFDRYAFGEMDKNFNDDDDDSLYQSYKKILRELSEEFQSGDGDLIVAATNHPSEYEKGGTYFGCYYRIEDVSGPVSYDIFHLGDYCYCICEHRRGRIVSITKIDGIDELIERIKEL